MQSEERRKSPRRRVRKGARILVDGHQVAICTIRNLSDGGAKLAATGLGQLPNRFDLHVDSGGAFNCEVIWRTDAEIGVRFLK